LLIVGLFLDWYDDLSAFTSFEVLDLALAVLALASLVALASPFGVRLPGRRALGPPDALWLGLVASAVILSQLIGHPPAAIGRDVGTGLWLSLGGALLIVAGSLLAFARISLAVDVERRRAEPAADERPAAVDPDAPTVTESGPGPERPA
jgi:hypothetical protein